MNRREVLKSSMVAGAAVAAGQILSQTAQAATTGSVADARSHCIEVGRVCAQHCVEQLGNGNKDMAACLSTVNDMLAACEALQKLHAGKSKHAGAMAKVCLETLTDCHAACEKHAKMAACKDCADACKACIAACKAMT